MLGDLKGILADQVAKVVDDINKKLSDKRKTKITSEINKLKKEQVPRLRKYEDEKAADTSVFIPFTDRGSTQI